MLRRVTRVRALTFALVAVLLFSVSATAQVWLPPQGPSTGGARWTTMFRFDRNQTYTYRLTAYNWNRVEMTGTFSITPLASGQVRFSYDVNGLRGSGVAPAEPKALAGAVLLSALTNLGYHNLETVKLLTAPLYWMNWADLFADARFRTGEVWEASQHPRVYFEAYQRYSWSYNSQYDGVIYEGRTPKAELIIDLVEPLPLEVVVLDGRWEFVAQLQTQWVTPILR